MISKYLWIIVFYIITSINGFPYYRLDRSILPSYYFISFQPHFENGTFNGEVTINIKFAEPQESIYLHCGEINVTDVYFDKSKANFQLFPKYELISVSRDLSSNNTYITPGEHVIHIKYIGSLIGDNLGFRKFSYRTMKGKGYLLATDFEPTSARRAFPCFDEPFFKARFAIRLISPNDTYTALSNMPEINRFKTSKGIVHDFQVSVPMPTYLVSFALTNCNHSEKVYSENGRDVPIRIYSYNASLESNGMPLKTAADALKYFTHYTGIKYPLSKLDMIEYRRNKSVATENWGLITFKEGILSPYLQKYAKSQIKIAVTHELSHFWFGNLVTNDWWSDIWLQEGFATFMSFKAISHNTGEDMTTVFPFDYLDDVYWSDRSTPSRPVIDYLESPYDIETHFNDITYYKGAIILYMLETVIGEEKFQEIVKQYLVQYAYGTAATNDFLTIVESKVPDMNKRGFLETWLYQNRYPIISISENGNDTYTLTQAAANYVNSSTSEYGNRWTIPLTYNTDQNNTRKLVWFDREMDKVVIHEPGSKWIKLNNNHTGFYRTNYTENMWNTFIEHYEELAMTERGHLLHEAGHLFELSLITCDIPIRLLSKIKSVEESFPWTFSVRFVFYLQDSLDFDKRAQELFKNFCRKRFHTFSELKKNKTESKKNFENNENKTTQTGYLPSTDAPLNSNDVIETDLVIEKNLVENNITELSENALDNNNGHINTIKHGQDNFNDAESRSENFTLQPLIPIEQNTINYENNRTVSENKSYSHYNASYMSNNNDYNITSAPVKSTIVILTHDGIQSANNQTFYEMQNDRPQESELKILAVVESSTSDYHIEANKGDVSSSTKNSIDELKIEEFQNSVTLPNRNFEFSVGTELTTPISCDNCETTENSSTFQEIPTTPQEEPQEEEDEEQGESDPYWKAMTAENSEKLHQCARWIKDNLGDNSIYLQ